MRHITTDNKLTINNHFKDINNQLVSVICNFCDSILFFPVESGHIVKLKNLKKSSTDED